MKEPHYILEKGIAELDADTLLIDDNAKREWSYELVIVVSLGVMGTAKLHKGIERSNYFDIALGVIFFAVTALTLWNYRFRTTYQKEILLSEIKEVVFTKRKTKWLYASIVLKTGKYRLISLDENFDGERFIQMLQQRGIKVRFGR